MGPEGGFYDIDISLDDMTITWTLKDNKGAGHLVLGEGSFDRYYVVFDQSIASAMLVEKANLNPKVTVAYYEETDIADLFGSGLPFPEFLEDNIILLEVQPGGNMTEVGQMMKVKFSFVADPPTMEEEVVEEVEEVEEVVEEEMIEVEAEEEDTEVEEEDTEVEEEEMIEVET